MLHEPGRERRPRLASGLNARDRYRPRHSKIDSGAAARSAGKDSFVKVAASSLRKGSVLDIDGKLYVVLNAENIHPGKGTPVTQLNMRRISDGVKVTERYRTTEQVDRAEVDNRPYTFLYQDGEGFHFMNPDNYNQVVASNSVVGEAAPYLQDGMTVSLSTHNDIPISLDLPRTAVLEIVETEPSVKGQTASSSYKPALLSNGVRTTVPPYLSVGARIVVLTEDGSYQERAKD
jgi:elongation factor P